MFLPLKTLASTARNVARAVLLACAFGCVHVDQTITLHADGSGELALRYGMSLENIAQMEAMSRQAVEAEGGTNDVPPPTPFDFDEAAVREDFEEFRERGVTLESIRSEVRDGWKYLSLKIRFASLAGLAGTEFVSDRGITLVRREDGNYEFRQAAPPGNAAPEMDGVNEMMTQMMEGFRAVVSVVAPSPVVESNADRTDGRTVTWVFDLAKDPRALVRAQQMDLRVVFEGAALALSEFKGVQAE